MKLNRRFIIRTAAILFLILFAILMALVGKQHTILLDNKNIEINNQELKAFQLVEVQVDNEPSLELARRDRVQAIVQGQRHKIIVTYTDDDWNEIVLEKKVKFPFKSDMYIFSIPAFVNDVNDIDSYLQEFIIEGSQL